MTAISSSNISLPQRSLAYVVANMRGEWLSLPSSVGQVAILNSQLSKPETSQDIHQSQWIFNLVNTFWIFWETKKNIYYRWLARRFLWSGHRSDCPADSEYCPAPFVKQVLHSRSNRGIYPSSSWTDSRTGTCKRYFRLGASRQSKICTIPL